MLPSRSTYSNKILNTKREKPSFESMVKGVQETHNLERLMLLSLATPLEVKGESLLLKIPGTSDRVLKGPGLDPI